MKITFGFDIGVASIGWAAIGEKEDGKDREILDCGVRVVPLATDEVDEFRKGGSVPTNVARRQARGARRGLQRFRLRRSALIRALDQLGMKPDDRLYRHLPPAELFSLRDRAIQEPLSLPEIGRTFLHLNLRRGFRSSRKTETDKKESEYKEEIKQREAELALRQQTIGQRFADGLRNNPNYRVRQQIFNRSSYMDEFDQIWKFQSAVHPEVMTESARKRLRDRVIYMQRPLKSAKGLVGECALEWNYALDKQTRQPILLGGGRKKIVRPKCAPKSSPLAQECKLWESIHNIRITDERGNNYPLTDEHKRQIFEILQQEEKDLSASRLLKDVLKISTRAYRVDNLVDKKGLEGNKTRAQILSAFKKTGDNRPDLLVFNPAVETVEWDNPADGTRISRLQLRGDFDKQPLYELWHLIYATQEESDLIRILQERYQFTPEQAQELAALDFTAAGYARKSHRAMRRLLPHYRNGLDYTRACEAAGYNHSNSITKAENMGRTLLSRLDVIPKNSLRNPVVEKILNQLVHVVNELLTIYGNPDEICVELARELRQSASERQEVTKQNFRREKEHKQHRIAIAEQLGKHPDSVTKNQIEKWKLGLETDWQSPYTGKRIDMATFLLGEQVDIEHIIPRVRRFDDSFGNKTICESRINQEKGDMTAHDFMKAQRSAGIQPYEDYLRMVKSLLDDRKISKTKYRNLMMTAEDVAADKDFLARQLRETQYITSTARTMLMEITRTVRTTSGGITDFLRHQWGWDEVIHDSRLDQFRQIGLTKEILIRNGTKKKEVIVDWNKRKDHRHHAVDALVTACTTQAHVQRLNNLNQTLEGKEGIERRNELRQTGGRDKYLAGPAPFRTSTVSEAMANVLVSYKQSNKVATRSRNNPKGSKKGKQVTLTPRGALHKETIYGKIKRYAEKPTLLNSKFKPEWIEKIAHDHQKVLVQARLEEFGGDVKKAFKDLEKNPIFHGINGEKQLKAVTLWEEWYVAREAIGTSTSPKKVSLIVDGAVKIKIQDRLNDAGGDTKKAFSNMATDPIYTNTSPVRSARILNPAEQMIKLPRGYAKSDGNHHIAIYRDVDGKKHEHVVSYWDAFNRMQVGLPAIIKDVAKAYEHVEQYGGEIPDNLVLPENPDWQFVISLAINDMFIFGFDPGKTDFTNPVNRKIISKGLFKVRKLTSGNYWFLHHLETEILEDVDSKKANRCKQCSISSLSGAVKVKVNRTGKIVTAETVI
jgi:CRISPR-associated endonuclease Csn1